MRYNFEKAFDLMMDVEGGMNLHKNVTETDVTFAGVYKKYHGDWEGWQYIERGETPPVSLVKSFYREKFWDKIKGDELEGGIDLVMFDFAVNSDPYDANKVLQSIIGVKADGIVGSKTLCKLEQHLSGVTYTVKCAKLVEEICARRLAHMMQSPKEDLEAYGLGWSRRVCRGLLESLKIVIPF